MPPKDKGWSLLRNEADDPSHLKDKDVWKRQQAWFEAIQDLSVRFGT